MLYEKTTQQSFTFKACFFVVTIIQLRICMQHSLEGVVGLKCVCLQYCLCITIFIIFQYTKSLTAANAYILSTMSRWCNQIVREVICSIYPVPGPFQSIELNVSGISTAYNLSNTFNVWKIAGNSAGCIYAVLLYSRSCKELKNLCNLPKYGFALNYVIAAYVFCDIGWTRHVVE